MKWFLDYIKNWNKNKILNNLVNSLFLIIADEYLTKLKNDKKIHDVLNQVVFLTEKK